VTGRERRWDSLEGRWVLLTQGRQARPLVGTGEEGACPFCPGAPPFSELPHGDYRVAVFENRYPPLGGEPTSWPRVEAGQGQGDARGRAEVVVYTPLHHGSLGSLEDDHLADVVRVWADRTHALFSRHEVRYVFIFENRGSAVGATVSHPHGQIYALPIVPPRLARLGRQERAWREEHGECLVCQRLRAEEGGERWIEGDERTAVYASFAPRFPYQVEIVPRRCIALLDELTDQEMASLGRLLGRTVRRLDAWWGEPTPYMLAVLQGSPWPLPAPLHLRVEVAPLWRAPGRAKVLAASESLGETFLADVPPEEAARALRGLGG
jgi:UDPglucose--hexose-1-phosphate uridylyltransferase